MREAEPAQIEAILGPEDTRAERGGRLADRLARPLGHLPVT
jgi:hypothetical protein